MSSDQRTIVGLDLIRFFAALLVAYYHLGYKAFAIDDHQLNNLLDLNAAQPAWWATSWFGFVGVQIFFVISGFVIAFSSEKTTSLAFARSRILRLVPGMWICATLCFAIALAWAPQSAVWLSLLLGKSLLFAPIGPWIAGQIWTLPIEIMFYGAILLLVAFGQFHRVQLMALALTLASVVYWVAMSAGLTDPFGRISQLLLLQHGAYFGLGIAMWAIYRGKHGALNFAIIALAVCVAFVQLQATTIAEHPGYGLERWYVVPFVAWLLTIGLLGLLLRVNGSLVEALQAWLPAIRVAGLMTYPFYLLHYHVGGATMDLMVASGQNSALALVAGIAVSLVASFIIAAAAEPFLRNLLKVPLDNLMYKRPRRAR